jgi:hypothetical protein
MVHITRLSQFYATPGEGNQTISFLKTENKYDRRWFLFTKEIKENICTTEPLRRKSPGIAWSALFSLVLCNGFTLYHA